MSQRKVALINVRDYGGDRYSAYYEIDVDGNVREGFRWRVRIYDRKTAEVLGEWADAAETRDEADTAAQLRVLNEMERYRVT